MIEDDKKVQEISEFFTIMMKMDEDNEEIQEISEKPRNWELKLQIG